MTPHSSTLKVIEQSSIMIVCVICLHPQVRLRMFVDSYLSLLPCAEVEDVTSSRSYADGGAYLTLPMFYLEGKRSYAPASFGSVFEEDLFLSSYDVGRNCAVS